MRRQDFCQIDVLGVGISAVNMSTVMAEIENWIGRGRREYVCAVDVNSLMHAQWNSEVRGALNGAGLATTDGVPLLWAAKWARAYGVERVAGPRLMPALCARAANLGWRVFFLGGADGVPEKVAETLVNRYPNLKVAGWASPPFRELSEREDQDLVDQINLSEADIVWVSLGAPKQELWMAAHRRRLNAAVLIGVGAAFTMQAGMVREAPKWIQPTGFEWVYRLVKEPRRLGPRYLKSHPAFVRAIVRNPPFVRPSQEAIGDSGDVRDARRDADRFMHHVRAKTG